MHGLHACLGTPPSAHNIWWWTGGWNVVVGRGGCVDWASWFTRVPSRKVPTIPESTVSLSACSQALSIASANFACMISNCSCNRQWHPPGVPPPVVGPASEQWPHTGPTFHCVSWCLGRVGIAANPSFPPSTGELLQQPLRQSVVVGSLPDLLFRLHNAWKTTTDNCFRQSWCQNACANTLESLLFSCLGFVNGNWQCFLTIDFICSEGPWPAGGKSKV